MNTYLKDKKFYINGIETIVLAGEIHYFRIPKQDWQLHINYLKEAGFNTVSTYIPWVIHEQIEGDFDLTGKYKSQYNIIEFMQLVYENGLYFIARPGPFVMAEMINDGIPTWLSENYPSCLISTWSGKKATTVDLDYLDENYLFFAKRWFEKIIPHISKYQNKNLLAIQLDNEIGMLSWVSNCPCLNDQNILSIQKYFLRNNISLDFNIDDIKLFKENLLNPTNINSPQIHYYLHDYYREKFKKYVHILKNWCDIYLENCIYLINIHGTGASRLFGYPIGLSQLYKTYEKDINFLAGSDIYFENLNVQTVHDTYLANQLTIATNKVNQPLASLEFNASDSDYGFNYSGRVLSNTHNLRSRLMINQGAKLFNYYLFSGGFNDFMNNKMNNGFDRIATTGEKHGYGSLIKHDNSKNYTFENTKKFGLLMKNLNHLFASLEQQTDDICVGFIPDYFKNEYLYEHSEISCKIKENIVLNTRDAANDVFIKYLTLKSINFSCQNIQDYPITAKFLVINSALYMDNTVQENIVTALKNGSKLLLFGEIPEYNLCNKKCTVLMDYLQIKKSNTYTTNNIKQKKVCVVPTNNLPSCFVNQATAINSTLNYEKILTIYPTDDATAIYVDEKAIIFNCQYRCDIQLFDLLLNTLNFKQLLNFSTNCVGSFSSLLKNSKNEKILSIINMDDFDREITYNIDNLNLKITVESLSGLFIPLNIKTDHYIINYATGELAKYNDNTIVFNLSSSSFQAKITTNKSIYCSSNFISITKEGTYYLISKTTRLYNENTITLQIK